MKKFYFPAIIIFFMMSSLFAQSSKYQWLAKDSWSFGGGLSYPKYISTSISVTDESGYGGYLSIQRNFSEHVGLRLKTSYLHLEGKAGGGTVDNNLILGDLDLLYYLIPCEPISPFAGVGIGLFYNTIENSPTNALNKSNLDYQLNFIFGAEWRIDDNWNLKTGFGYHTTASSKFDGTYGTTGGGVLGGFVDSYMTFDLGFLYYFSKGEKSNICDIYEGINANIDYDKIEEIVKKYAVTPAEIDYTRIEDIVMKHKSNVSSVTSNWVLIGVNFDFNKANLRPESLPILYNAVDILLTNPDIRVEIQGHTDNIGSDNYNQKLSLQRAETVRNFLIAKGVAPSRLTAVGVGELKPIMDNSTVQGRELNRRIEFRVLN